MRSPGRRRPRKGDQLPADSDLDLDAMAEKVTYVISPEHKDYLTSAGPGKLRSDASACPRHLDFDDVLNWLKAAIRNRSVSADFDGDFPRYVWVRVEGSVFEGRLSNSGLGGYKGYPIRDYEAPSWLE
ncbi:hypothetical protein [Actinoplanes sp. NBRC 103695]|uniref:hypothetical protein n=1 Tax=Actinoplanes sp. NBRC 103695 TaxID=3032202 RepID=UPI0025562165|nr:hypothetical protein [Actinoplanes sp. NBRC 103695]